MSWTVYILFSPKLQRFYTGCTADFPSRMERHLLDPYNKSNFTAKANDWEIFLHFECSDEVQAKSIEHHIKKMKSKVYIENLRRYPEMVKKLLEKYKSDC